MLKSRARRAVAVVGLAICAAVSAGSPASAAGPSRLTVEQQPHPRAVENLGSPAFGWAVNDARIGARQTAYQIRVGTSAGSADVWDSGKVTSDASANVAYAGPALKSSRRYWWSVRTWGAHGSAGPWSAPASFGRFGNVTTPQFIAFAERESGQDLDHFFDVWLYQPGKPTSW